MDEQDQEKPRQTNKDNVNNMEKPRKIYSITIGKPNIKELKGGNTQMTNNKEIYYT